MSITDKTRELLLACKDAGYKVVTVLVRDKRVPLSKKIKRGWWFGDQPSVAGPSPIKVICAAPEQLDEIKLKSGTGAHYRPKMWRIIEECGLVNGMKWGACGLSDSKEIHPDFLKDLTPGCYDLCKPF